MPSQPTATAVELNDLRRARSELTSPLRSDSYRQHRGTGRPLVTGEGVKDTVPAGAILDAAAETRDVTAQQAKTQRSPNVKWQGSKLTRRQRWESLGNHGATVWFTGLPGSGKSTIATAVEELLVRSGHPAFLLDGDNLRHGLNGDLGFDEVARCENVRRTAHVARLIAESGTIALVSLVSPYAKDRELASSIHAADDLHFIEIHVDTPLKVCEERDPKGLYTRARNGELRGMTGVDAPYERPAQPDIAINTAQQTLGQAVDLVIQTLAARLPRAR